MFMSVQGFYRRGDSYDTIKGRNTTLQTLSTLNKEVNRVDNQVQSHLAKPEGNEKVVFSKVQKVFPSHEEIRNQRKF
jgi:hypothetical protein